MSTKQSYQALNDTVIANGFCIGCGACAVFEQSPFGIVMDEYGQFQSRLNASNVASETGTDYEKLCPFGFNAPNEDDIAKRYFSESCEYNTQVGYYKGVYAGHVTEGEFRNRGSSGGMGTWMLNELMAKELVDYVVHVKSGEEADDLNSIPFGYRISDTLEDIQKGGKSRYYPIELSEVLKTVRNQPGRYAVIGLPCFIKSIRLLQDQDPILAERIRYCVGLVCGHLKSARYAESLAWQMGIVPTELQAIDFRVKDPSQPANRYSTYASSASSGKKTVPTNQLFGTDWGAGAFKYKACDFCDDVFAETADVVLGDAWLPEYVKDSYGTNVVVTRNDELRKLIINACSEGRLALDELSIKKAIQSQDAGLRHRKVSIGYRLHCEKTDNAWVPTKRANPSRTLSPRYEMKRQQLRTKLRDFSHKSFRDAKIDSDLSIYINTMQSVYKDYSRQGLSFIRRLLSFTKRKINIFLGR
ncbi:Coenzyme F420 hydrogenase/dehydrogenase, beta subunit C-terminal domain [Zobellella denitrificans]